MWLVKDKPTGREGRTWLGVKVKYVRDVFDSLVLPGNCKHAAEVFVPPVYKLHIIRFTRLVCTSGWAVSCIS